MRRYLAIAVLGLASIGCFQQVVRTGVTPGERVIERPWVSTWIFGLVEAAPIDVRAECPMGVATVRTQQSFANGLVALVTLGIYTPQHVTITCAAGTGSERQDHLELHIPASATAAEAAEVLRRAIAMSLANGESVTLRF